MTDNIQTQCPNCQARFPLTAAHLAKGNVPVRCGRCGTSFAMLDNIVVHHEATTDTLNLEENVQPTTDIDDFFASNPIDEANSTDQISDFASDAQPLAANNSSILNTKSAQTPNKDDVIDDDMLIHDDMGDEGDSADVEWDIEQFLKSNLPVSAPADAFDKEFQESVNPEEEDESWIDSLLKDETLHNRAAYENSVSLHSPMYSQNTDDLDDFLDDLGVSKDAPVEPDRTQTLAIIDERILQKSPQSVQTRRSPIVPILWGIGCLLLLLLLLAQYVIFNLDYLLKNPEHKAKLEQFCTVVACSLPDADINKITLTNQTQRPNLENAKESDLIAVLSNTSDTDQLTPDIKVVINGADGVIGSFIAAPDQYLVTPQRELAPKQVSIIMLTVPIENKRIKSVVMTPIY